MTKKIAVILPILILAGISIYLWQSGYKLQSPFARNGRPAVQDTTTQNSIPREQDYPEVASVGSEDTFEELKIKFLELAKAKGGRYAFEVLKRVSVGPNIDMHLLGHVVGDELYKQEGVDGMTACDQDFRNACSHAIVVGLFGDKGEAALPEITEACRKAPGGRGAYTMCFHGLGHGILSAVGYDMEKLSLLCEKTGTEGRGNSEVVECIGGSVMEIVGGGFHDREVWQAQRKIWLDAKKPLTLCQQKFIPEFARFMCYEYITPFLFEAAGGDMGRPTAQDFEKAFKFCEAVPISQGQNRDACFGGFGKEFDGLVASRDIRQGSFDRLSEESLSQVYQWCLLARPQDGKGACVVHAVNSLYWGGENNRAVSVRFCRANADEYLQRSCFVALITAVSYYINDTKYRQEFCVELPPGYLNECKSRLGL